MTEFQRLSTNWNAEPNAPDPEIQVSGKDLVLSFEPNPYMYPAYESVSKIVLTFKNCKRYRLGPTNDEGWLRGQCRFSAIAPAWGEFYKVTGDLELDMQSIHWIELGPITDQDSHFLFYFRDDTFECDAESWSKSEYV